MAESKEQKTAKVADKAGTSRVGVFVKGRLVREYSAEQHGGAFLDNAESFAKQFGDSEVRKLD